MPANMHHMNIHDKHLYSCGGLALTVFSAHNPRIMNIAKLRKAKGLNQTELAEMASVTQPTISRAEKGDDSVTLGNYKAIAAALGVPLSDLFLEDRTTAEMAIVRAYRRLPPERQQGWQDMLKVADLDQ